MKLLTIAALTASLLAPAGFASTHLIEERKAPGGDYADALGAPTNQLGSVPPGTTATNLIGSMACDSLAECGDQGNDGFDAFYFTVDPNQTISNVRITTETNAFGFRFTLLDVSGPSAVRLLSGTINANTTFQLPLAPLGPGQYNFGFGFETAPAGDPIDASYTIASTVTTGTGPSPVPLPAGLPLLIAGLGAFDLLRRRKNANKA